MLALGRALGRLADRVKDAIVALIPDDLFDCWLEEGEEESDGPPRVRPR